MELILNIEDAEVRGRHGVVPVRIYTPPGGAVESVAPLVWAHGGAFAWGDLDVPEAHAVAMAVARTGREVVSVDYRRVPPFSWVRRLPSGRLPGIRFPIPLDDVIDVFTWVQARSAGAGTVLGGASAGACLAAAATLRLWDEGQPGPAGLVLVYGTFHASLPALSGRLASRIRGRHRLGQFMPGVVDKMNRNYAGTAEALQDRHAFPGGGELGGFPPTLVLDADRDALGASGEAFAAELAAAGVDIVHARVPGSRHGFLNRPQRPHFGLGIRVVTDWLLNRSKTVGADG
ncbi:alpha/beta hydrolase fold domain-containing protein [Amycolatopsis sp. NPDC005003]